MRVANPVKSIAKNRPGCVGVVVFGPLNNFGATTLLLIAAIAVVFSTHVNAQAQTVFIPGDNHTWEVDYEDGKAIGRFIRQSQSFLDPAEQRRLALYYAGLAGIPDANVHNIYRGAETDGNIYVRKTLLERTLTDLAFKSQIAAFEPGTTVNIFAHSGGAPLALWSACTTQDHPVSVLTLSAPGLDTFRLHRRGFSGDPILADTKAPATGLFEAWREGNIIRNAEMLSGCEAKMREGMRIRIIASATDEFVSPDLWNELIWRFSEMNEGDSPMPEDYFRAVVLENGDHAEVGEYAARHHGRVLRGEEGDIGVDWRKLDPFYDGD